MNPSSIHPPVAQRPTPWWRFGMVWLVISGPAVVVVASFISAWVAWGHIDPVIVEPPVASAGHDASLNASLTSSLTPAMKARNHAATPRKP